jgi:hypothetical protein
MAAFQDDAVILEPIKLVVADLSRLRLMSRAAALDRQHQVKHMNALEELAERIDDALSVRGENPHRRK